MAEARARLQHAGEQLIEARATADERERGLVQDLEAARAESAARVLEAEAASQAAEERERALQEEVDAVRADVAAQTCSLKLELEAGRQAMMAVHTDAEDKVARLLAAESEMRALEDVCRQGQAAAVKWEEMGRRLSVEIEGLGKEAREEKERATKLEGELAAAFTEMDSKTCALDRASTALKETQEAVHATRKQLDDLTCQHQVVLDDLVKAETQLTACAHELEEARASEVGPGI